LWRLYLSPVISHEECSQSEVETRRFIGHGPLLYTLWKFDGKDDPVILNCILADGYCLDAAVNGTALMESVRAFADLDVALTFKFPSRLLQGEGAILDRLPERGRGDTPGTSTGLPFNDVFEEPLKSRLNTFDSVLHGLGAKTLPVQA
jgi:hypothetical protein